MHGAVCDLERCQFVFLSVTATTLRQIPNTCALCDNQASGRHVCNGIRQSVIIICNFIRQMIAVQKKKMILHILINKQFEQNYSYCYATVNSPQFTPQILSPKSDVHIASRNNHHDDSSGTPNLLENSLIYAYSPALQRHCIDCFQMHAR